MRRFFFTLHKWTGLIFGLFFIILCFTGAILAFRNEIATLFGYPNDHAMPFLQTVLKFHRWLFMAPQNPHGGMSAGRFIVGLATLCSSFTLISGIIIWWPKNKAMLKSRFSIHFHKGWHRFVHDSHVSLGIYVVIFVLAMTLTGPSWSFTWYGNGVNSLLGSAGHPIEMRVENQGKNGDAQSRVTVTSLENQQNTHPQAGAQAGPSFKRGGGVIGIHTGTWGGITTQLLYCLAALIGGFLPISGYYMWWRKRQNKGHQS